MYRLIIILAFVVGLVVVVAPLSAEFVPDPSVDIIKQAEGPDSQTVVSGSDVTFVITVANTGNLAFRSVDVTDVKTPACNRSFDSSTPAEIPLAPGDSFSYTCTAANVTSTLV